MNTQAPNAIFLIRPVAIGNNPETASSNFFQHDVQTEINDMNGHGLVEFDRFIGLLESNDIETLIFEDTKLPHKPDAHFPNNWITTHQSGEVIIYPMMAQNRRAERRNDIIEYLNSNFSVSEVVDLSAEADHGKFLEGTGSMVFDYVNKIAYACRSPRTDESLMVKVCNRLGFKSILFNAVDESNNPIYHTNVMMCIGEKFAVLCLDAIKDEDEQDLLLSTLASTHHKVVAISYEQMQNFAGNMIELKTRNNEPVVVLSERAFNSLLPGQINAISSYADMIPVSIPTIEKCGGGSVRCMIAGIYLPKS